MTSAAACAPRYLSGGAPHDVNMGIDAREPLLEAADSGAVDAVGVEPAHGTRWRYQSPKFQCRCAPCRYAQRDYRKARKGAPHNRVPVITTRQHINSLRSAGMSLVKISALSGVSRRTITRIMRGDGPEHNRIDRDIRDAVLAVEMAPDDGHWIDPGPTREKLRELTLNGWRQADLARKLGYRYGNALHRLINSRTARIRVTTAAKVDVLFAELKDVPGDSSSAKKLATSKWSVPDPVASHAAPSFDNGFHDRRYSRRDRRWPEHLTA